MRISVVVRTHNRSEVLKECLESITKQDFKDYEILVVDDHSTDNTWEVAKQFNCRYITTVGKGRAATRNTGVRAAYSNLVAFCDDDTIVPKDWLKTIYKTLTKNGYDAVGFTYYYPPEFRGKVWSLMSYLNHKVGPKIFALALGVEAVSLGGGSGGINKRIIEKLGYWSETKIRAEDLDYGVRFLRAGFKKKNIEGMMIVHKHHRIKRADEEGYYNKEYQWMKTMLGLVENNLRNRLIMIGYIKYRLLIHLGFCVATRSLKPVDMTRGNIAAFKEWVNQSSQQH